MAFRCDPGMRDTQVLVGCRYILRESMRRWSAILRVHMPKVHDEPPGADIQQKLRPDDRPGLLPISRDTDRGRLRSALPFHPVRDRRLQQNLQRNPQLLNPPELQNHKVRYLANPPPSVIAGAYSSHGPVQSFWLRLNK